MPENFDLSGFQKRLREERLKRNLTQDKLSLDLNYSPNYITLLENGHRNLSLSALNALALYFDVSSDFLLSGYSKIPSDELDEIAAPLSSRQRDCLSTIIKPLLKNQIKSQEFLK